MKITVVGGGSTYTPELMDGLISHAQQMRIDSLCLMDIDRERLKVLGGFCSRMLQSAGSPFALELSEDLDSALDGAGFVITQVRVGGQAGRHKDIMLGLGKDLIGQETTGVGGFAKAMRTVPVILDVCKHMERACPDAWLVNFTNPSGIVTEAVLKHGRERVIGLCNIPVHMKMDVAKLLGVPPEKVELDYIGLNHLSWVRRVLVDGEDVLSSMMQRLKGAGRPVNIPEELDYPQAFLEALGAIPNSYLNYYYRTNEALAELKAKKKSRAQEVMDVERELLDVYRDPRLNKKPEALDKRGGAFYSTAAVELMNAIISDEGSTHVVNVRCKDSIECLPYDCAVEIPCKVDASGAHALALNPPNAKIRGLLQHVKAYEELAVQAAVTRKKDAAIMALVSHPLVADPDKALLLVDEISTVHGIQWK